MKENTKLISDAKKSPEKSQDLSSKNKVDISVKRIDIVHYLDDLKITPSSEEYAPAYVEYLCEKINLKISEVPKHIYDEINKIRTCYILNNNNLQKMVEKSWTFFHTDVMNVKRPNVILDFSFDSTKSAFKDPNLRKIFKVWILTQLINVHQMGEKCQYFKITKVYLSFKPILLILIFTFLMENDLNHIT